MTHALESTYHFLATGGIVMVLLLLLSVISLTVAILRGLVLRDKVVMPPSLIQEIERLQPGDSLHHLRRLVEEHPSALGSILTVVVKHLPWPREENIEAVQTRAREEVLRLESGLIILEVATGIAPLLGLLGTLAGLVSIFANVGADPLSVARGISEALSTTIVGLAVAVPSLIFFNYFSRKVETFAVRMEAISSDLLAKCYPHGGCPVVEEA